MGYVVANPPKDYEIGGALHSSAIALSLTQITQLAQAIALQLIPLPALVLSDRTFSYTNYTTSTSDRPTTYPTARASIKRSHFLLHKLHN
jgi:hypothetical protein